jgi:polyisoprenoid-binding protein YceI
MEFKIFLLTIAATCLLITGQAQVYNTDNGKAIFKVSAPAKVITGESNSVQIHINFKAGSVSVNVPVSSFIFQNNYVADTMNSIVKKRFNEYYMESTEYPRITYKGKIININSIKFDRNGVYTLHTKGIMEIHGVNQNVVADALLTVSEGKIKISAQIVIEPAKYKIRIPPYIGYMYFREVTVHVQGS